MGNEILSRVKNFFREDTSEVVGAYFDGEKIFLTWSVDGETVEDFADGTEVERLAEKISALCRQRGRQNSAVGFCLRDGDAVTFQTTLNHIPAAEIPSTVKSWAFAQTGKDACFAFARVGDEIWMETVPRSTVDNFIAAFDKFGLSLRALSVMPADMFTKQSPRDMTKFIADAVQNKNAPNLLARGGGWNLQKISAVVGVIFFCAVVAHSAKIFSDWHDASTKLDAAKISVDNLREDVALKNFSDEDVAAFKRLNTLAARVDVTKNFNLLLGLGKISGGDVHLTVVRAENILSLEGVAESSDDVKSYLTRVKNFVAPNVRLENSSERGDGEISFTLRAQR